MTKQPTNAYDQYHAHVYFDAHSVEMASSMCHQAGELFDIQVGRVHQKLVGPHPRWSCQLSFSKAQFDQLIPWLDDHRDHLTIFVHALTGNDLADHTTHASWLGDPVPLNLSVFGVEGLVADVSS
ncbi:DOPA 4,5-dioxygenase family protein [Acaryochloris sp. IP29b_bin.148]|uniref:DOPA 4,5-dioxygenase family protein n=1 Tax=Acaryochloris sp. IP29b_bin.148 TaxID=2969218 RepID=UPI002614F6B7|nr:DOPA 4,5-dioxygenase family protein [Acaryochloris sp. IP29b_bin.148]